MEATAAIPPPVPTGTSPSITTSVAPGESVAPGARYQNERGLPLARQPAKRQPVAPVSRPSGGQTISVSGGDANAWQVPIPGQAASFRVKQSGAGFGVYLRVTENGARPETYLCYLNAPDAAEAKGRGLEDFLSLILARIEQRQAKAKTAAERHRLADLAARIFAYLPAHPDTARAGSTGPDELQRAGN